MDNIIQQHFQLRHRPLGVRNKLYLLLHGPGSWLLMVSTLLFIFSLLLDVEASLVDYGKFSISQTQQARGTVVDTFDTNLEVNERTVNGIVFNYNINGIEMQNTSFAREWYPKSGAPVQIEYLNEDPSKARIRGTSYSQYGLFALIVLCIAMVLFVFALYRLRLNFLWIKLLQMGTVAKARLVNKRRTNMMINNQPVMALEFAFEDKSGKQHQWTMKTHLSSDLTDDKQELILYNENNPSVSPVLLDQMPERPDIQAVGKWKPLSIIKLLRALVIKVGIPLLIIWLFLV